MAHNRYIIQEVNNGFVLDWGTGDKMENHAVGMDLDTIFTVIRPVHEAKAAAEQAVKMRAAAIEAIGDAVCTASDSGRRDFAVEADREIIMALADAHCVSFLHIPDRPAPGRHLGWFRPYHFDFGEIPLILNEEKTGWQLVDYKDELMK